jgi:PAS domain-containing protein
MAPPGPAQYYLYLAAAAVVAASLLALLVRLLRRRGSQLQPKLRSQLQFLVAVSLGSIITNSLEMLSGSEFQTKFFAAGTYLFTSLMPVWWMLFALSRTGHETLARRLRFMIAAVPAVALAMVFTNDLHHLHWKGWYYLHVGPFTLLRATAYGWWFWVIYSLNAACALVGAGLLVKALFRSSRALNRQTALIAAAAAIPLLVNVIYVSRIFPDLQKDWSPVGYGLSALLLYLGAAFNRLFDLAPIARRALLEALDDPLVAVDGDGRVVDANPAARWRFSLPDEPIGAPAADSVFLALAIARCQPGHAVEVELTPDNDRWYSCRVAELPAGGRMLRLYALRDITAQRRLLSEKTALVDRLTKALADIRTLQGIIPICASCKKVRDDSGYWQQVEGYLASHTQAEFSHGLCPDCRQRLYPEIYGRSEA